MIKIKFSHLLLPLIGIWLGGDAQTVQPVQPRNALPNIFKKLQTQNDVTIAFLGGSITNHNGYRVYVTDWLKDQYPKCHINSINAGVGGTGSGLGVFRMDEDVLSKKPDMVFVEFAVNDGGVDSLTLQHSMEGIVRKIWKQNINTDIYFVYTCQITNLNDLNKGKYPHSAIVMEKVAEHYKIPSIEMGFVVANMVAAGKMDFKGSKTANTGKPYFSDDGTHPTIEFGHHIYADTIIGSLKQMVGMPSQQRKSLIPPLDEQNNEDAHNYPITDATLEGNWKILPTTDQLSKQFADKFQSIAFASDSSSKLTIKFKGTQIGFYDLLGPTSGRMKAVIDDGKPILVTRFDTYCVYTRANNFMFPVLKNGVHTLVLTPDETKIDKLKILKSRHTDAEIADTAKYDTQNVYLGKILVMGELVK
ncbi:SGNH/GDSL hydrolase family protein [uncultured Mucilaginibacter sp.]|uniref:SGNH/GDSL hydrolase family protein n=1 Tax=uncultured Mucilaginibacter sp. TaxID=797541 RepID=UPI0025DA3C8F|nr:SGNH/GDSL hydrolase family protein [uncultured Mucilaginibacter sp.]